MSKDPQMVVGKSTIRGEANIVRLIARLFPTVFDYDQDAKASLVVDEWMDRAVTDLLYAESVDPKKKFVHNLEDALACAKKKSLTGSDKLSIADYVVWSAIVKTGQCLNTGFLRKWGAECKMASGNRAQARTWRPSGRRPSGRRFSSKRFSSRGSRHSESNNTTTTTVSKATAAAGAGTERAVREALTPMITRQKPKARYQIWAAETRRSGQTLRHS